MLEVGPAANYYAPAAHQTRGVESLSSVDTQRVMAVCYQISTLTVLEA